MTVSLFYRVLKALTSSIKDRKRRNFSLWWIPYQILIWKVRKSQVTMSPKWHFILLNSLNSIRYNWWEYNIFGCINSTFCLFQIYFCSVHSSFLLFCHSLSGSLLITRIELIILHDESWVVDIKICNWQ